MQALGFIETKGLLAAIESADAMLKAAEVSLVEKTLVGGGLVSVVVTGDVAAVKAAVDAGAAAVKQLDSTLLITEHVIPRPHQELDGIVITSASLIDMEMPTVAPEKTQLNKKTEVELVSEDTTETPVEVKKDAPEDLGELHKEALDKLVKKKGLKEAISELSGLKVVKLRNLAREYKGFGIAGRLISKADKTMLIEEFTKYYSKK